jgi:hypothetical protein
LSTEVDTAVGGVNDRRWCLMEHDSTQLTPEERRIFADIERGVAGELGSSTQRSRWRPRPSSDTLRWIWRIAIILGTAVLAGGLWIGAVAVAFVGFVALLVGLSHVITDGITGRSLDRLRQRLEHISDGDARESTDGDGEH